jgi:hypothetical protein
MYGSARAEPGHDGAAGSELEPTAGAAPGSPAARGAPVRTHLREMFQQTLEAARSRALRLELPARGTLQVPVHGVCSNNGARSERRQAQRG